MNTNQYQSLSTEREEIMSIIPDLKPEKSYPVPDVETMPSENHVQNAEAIVPRTDRATQPGYISDAELLGLDLYVKPPEPVYRRIQLPNYAGPAFRAAMAIVDASFNWPLVFTGENVIFDPTAVLEQAPPTPEVEERRTEDQILVERDDDPVTRRWSSDRNVPWISESETGNADTKPQAKVRRRSLWSRTKLFLGRMFCCGANLSDE
ncbi:unnamed protein product [Macrosiphum euphorbiae]|uniref:Uncharacterized protein n=1 Tax=Macrosiphum euphorbiae TaxID=13131 RepID=A0AAV0VJA7_9HEMI|nr:unnamed protein product [Macrosiphum euphorbiae]